MKVLNEIFVHIPLSAHRSKVPGQRVPKWTVYYTFGLISIRTYRSRLSAPGGDINRETDCVAPGSSVGKASPRRLTQSTEQGTIRDWQ